MPDLSMAAIPPFGMILDVLVIAAVIGLWLAWWRNLNRLHKTEQLLVESIQQLEQASSQLQQATDHIRAIEKKKDSAARTKKPVRSNPAPAGEPGGNTVLTRTLRLQRQGKSDQQIADILNIPIIQVRLMLKMHTVSAD